MRSVRILLFIVAGGAGGAVNENQEKRLRVLEKAEESRKKAKIASKGFSSVGLEEMKDIFSGAGVSEGPKRELPASVIADATNVVLAPELPYQWKEGETEPAATPILLSILSARLGHSVVDARTVKLRTEGTEPFQYTGFADGALLPAGYEASTTFVLSNAVALVEFKERKAFQEPAEHVPQSLLELLATALPVFTTDMTTGFKAWVREGKVFHPYHGNLLLSLQEGIALMRYFVAQKDIALASRDASSGGSSDSSSSSSSSTSSGQSEQGSLPPSSGLDSSAPSSYIAGHGVAGHQRKACIVTFQNDEGYHFDNNDTETDVDDGPPTSYDDYKLRMMMYAEVLKLNGVGVPDSLLARLS